MNVVITGASRGIGKEIALQMAALGHEVMVVSRSAKALEQEDFKVPNIYTLLGDINEWTSTAKAIMEHWSKVDLLIHNAAAFVNRPFREMELKDMEEVYRANVYAPYFLTQALLPVLGSGSQVLAISSIGGIGGSLKFPGLSVYSSSKGALNIMLECLATELQEEGITVNALALGSSATEMFKAAFPGMEAASRPEDMAKFIVNFAFQAPGMVHGKVIPVSSSNP
jgi:NAD(P)-dependent dehydrogenase (short-subunit alcohol dehydrogenase family)